VKKEKETALSAGDLGQGFTGVLEKDKGRTFS